MVVTRMLRVSAVTVLRRWKTAPSHVSAATGRHPRESEDRPRHVGGARGLLSHLNARRHGVAQGLGPRFREGMTGRGKNRRTAWRRVGQPAHAALRGDYRDFPDLPERFATSHSVTAAFRGYGVNDYERASTRVSARRADAEEAAALRLAPGAILLVSEAIDADVSGRPILYGLSRFPADLLELVV